MLIARGGDEMNLGLAYPEAVADSVRERMTHRTQPDEDEFGSAAQRAQLESFRRLRIDLIAAERDALLVVRQSGTYPSAMLDRALTQLDAEQIGIELRR
jgi:CPA1 family monovalent cation:H+ antiporter